MSVDLFIVICRDRHTDPKISVHGSRAGADAKIEAFKAEYGDYYSWIEEDFGKDIGWLRCVVTEDEGPSARIESRRLEDASPPAPAFNPSLQDIQNLQSIRRAINRTAYHGGLGLRESGKMLSTMDRLLASFGVGQDDHGDPEL